MEDPDMGVTISALNALGQIGPAASEAVPSLIKRLGTGDAEVLVWLAICASKDSVKPVRPLCPPWRLFLTTTTPVFAANQPLLVGRFQSKAKPYIDALRKL
jgi:hypothetical protein